MSVAMLEHPQTLCLKVNGDTAMDIYQPYCYLIGWSNFNKFYYGVRYAKNCHPGDLWKTYFTSSKHVKNFRNKHGDPDIIQIRKTFSEAKQAVYYEQKVLRLLNVEKNKKFLNAKNSTTNTIITSPNKSSFKGGCTPWNKGKKSTLSAEERKKRYGRKFSKETKKYLSEKMHKFYNDNPEAKDKLRKANKKQFEDPVKRQKHLESFLTNNGNHKNTVWINNTIISKRVDKTHISNYINNGWVKGRLLKDTQFWKHGNRNKDPKTGRFVKKGE